MVLKNEDYCDDAGAELVKINIYKDNPIKTVVNKTKMGSN